MIAFHFSRLFHLQLSGAPSEQLHPPVCSDIWACELLRLRIKTSSGALRHKYQNTEHRRRPSDGTFMQSYMNMHAAIRNRGKRLLKSDCVRCSHTEKHTHIQTVLCQRGDSLFIYCLYTEKKESASIMEHLDSGCPQSPINLKAGATKALLVDKRDMPQFAVH